MRRLDATRFRVASLTVPGLVPAAMPLILLAALSTAAHARTTWDGGSTVNDFWTTGANWNTVGISQAPPPNNGTANIVFPAVTGAAQTPIVNVPYSIRSMTINSDGGNGLFVILCAEELTIGAGGVINNDEDLQSIIGPVKLAANQTWSAEGVGRLQFDNVNLNGYFVTLLPTNGPIDLVGVIGGAGGIKVVGGDFGLEPVTITGLGDNTYSGATSVDIHGELILNKPAGTIAVPGRLVIGYDAKVRLDADEQISPAPGNAVELVVGRMDLNGHTESIAVLRPSPYAYLSWNTSFALVCSFLSYVGRCGLRRRQ